MYYYPYYLHFQNLLSFRHINTINENYIINDAPKSIDLWSISRWSKRYKGDKFYTATYNCYTKNYEFCGKRFLSYDDVVNYALNV